MDTLLTESVDTELNCQTGPEVELARLATTCQ